MRRKPNRGIQRVEPTTPEFYRNNRIVTAERVEEIDRRLAEILSRLGDDDHITPGHPAKSSSGNKRQLLRWAGSTASRPPSAGPIISPNQKGDA